MKEKEGQTVESLRQKMAYLKMLLAVNAQFLGDIVRTLHDNGLLQERDDAVFLMGLDRLTYLAKDEEEEK